MIDRASRDVDVFAKKKLGCKKSLIELSCHSDIALWWFCRIFFSDLIKKICSDNKNAGHTPYKRFLIMIYYISEIFWDLGQYLFIAIFLRLYNKNPSQASNSSEKRCCKIIFTGQDIEWRTLKEDQHEFIRRTDVFFDSTLQMLLKNSYDVISVSLLDLSLTSVKISIDKWAKWNITHIPLNYYWNLAVSKKENSAKVYFSRIWNIIHKDKVYSELSAIYGKTNQNTINRELKLYFKVLFPLAVKYIEMAKNMIDAEKPDLIILQNEYGFLERSLIIAAKIKGIPTLAIQHGIIHPQHMGYIYQKEDISSISSIQFPFVSIPNITAVYGEYYRSILTQYSSYPNDSVIVTGQPRYDRIVDLNCYYSRSRFCETWMINPDKKLVLWLTQCHGLSDRENQLNFEAVFEAIKSLDNVQLVIKQHPGETERYTSMIQDAASRYSADVRILSKTADTLGLIFLCDLVIIRHSTAGLEALALQKPLVVMNLSGDPDPVDYVASGVAYGVYDKSKLPYAIENLLIDDHEIAMRREAYIEKYLYKVDGKATERVVDLIKRLCRNAHERGFQADIMKKL